MVSGCIRTGGTSPCFSVSYREARDLRRNLEKEPRIELERPVVLLSGYRALPSMVNRLHWRLAEMTTGEKDDFLAVAYPFEDNIDRAVDRAVAAVEAWSPSGNADETIEVDVVAISMGGLVARAAAEPPALRGRDGKRLKIRRLYTLATPHRGASLADHITLDQASRAMKPGSGWLADLNGRAHYESYELVCYGQTMDGWVGVANTAPPEVDPYWTPGTYAFSHFNAPTNPWFLVDIALRLRGEEPITTSASEPPK